MSRVRFNIAANLVGQASFVLLAVICTPFYIRLLGVEGYGLLAFYLLFQSILQLLDLGLGATVNREIARLSGKADPADRSALGELLATIERWYWIVGATLGAVLFVAMPSVAGWWLRPEHLSQDDLALSARIFGVIAFLQWLNGFYLNGLMGLQRQVLLNSMQVPLSVLSSIGGLLFIWLGPRSVSALLSWQAAVLLLQVGTFCFFFWKLNGVPRRAARVDLAVLRDKWRFSLGISGISIAGLVLTHLDKIILSRLLSLESFGVYSLAGTLARGLYVLMTPVFNAYFPRFSGVVSAGDGGAMRLTYHSAAQVMAVLSLPLAAIVVLFPGEIAYLWLHESTIAAAVSPIASLLAIGNCLNGLMSIPFALQLAHGNTRIGLFTSILLIVVLVPAIIVVTTYYGAVGGAAMWAVVNGLYIVVGVIATHRYLLVGEAMHWLGGDILPPLVVSVVIVGIGRLLVPHDLPALYSLPVIALLWVGATLCAAVSASHVRSWGRQFVAGLRAG